MLLVTIFYHRTRKQGLSDKQRVVLLVTKRILLINETEESNSGHVQSQVQEVSVVIRETSLLTGVKEIMAN